MKDVNIKFTYKTNCIHILYLTIQIPFNTLLTSLCRLHGYTYTNLAQYPSDVIRALISVTRVAIVI